MVQVPAWQVLAAPISQLLRTLLREDEEAAGGGGNQRDASAPDHKPLPDLDFDGISELAVTARSSTRLDRYGLQVHGSLFILFLGSDGSCKRSTLIDAVPRQSPTTSQ